MKLSILEPLGVRDEYLLDCARQALADRVEIAYFNTRTTDPEELIRRGMDADILVVSNLPLPRAVLEGCKRVKLISVAFTGVDHVAMDYCREQGILVCNCSGYSNHAVSELVFGGLLALYRSIIACDARTRTEGTKDGLIGGELYGKKFGVVGSGAIGSQVVRIARAFGCEAYVTQHKRAITDTDVKVVSLEEMLRTCDIVSLHVPLNASTRNLIGAEQIALMKSSAVLVNMARGPVVDSEALAEALNSGRLAGAVIDVFETEPPIKGDHPLVQAKNTVLTPHVAFASREALETRAKMVFDNVAAYLDHAPINVM